MNNKEILEQLTSLRENIDYYSQYVNEFIRLLLQWEGSKNLILQFLKCQVIEHVSNITVKNANHESCQILAILFPQITTLAFNNSRVSDEGCKYLSQMENLQGLFVEKNHITNEGCEHLSKLKNIMVLDLSHNQITDKGCEYLSHLQGCKTLYLIDNQLTDESCKYISKMNVTNLYLSQNQITEKGCKHLSQLQKVSRIDLRHNKLTLKGVKLLMRIKSLETLIISKGLLTNSEINQLEKKFIHKIIDIV